MHIDHTIKEKQYLPFYIRCLRSLFYFLYGMIQENKPIYIRIIVGLSYKIVPTVEEKYYFLINTNYFGTISKKTEHEYNIKVYKPNYDLDTNLICIPNCEDDEIWYTIKTKLEKIDINVKWEIEPEWSEDIYITSEKYKECFELIERIKKEVD
jgi:hypothetical protein